MNVRVCFGAKVRRAVAALNAPGTQQRASKYAAMLALAGMDPVEKTRRAAVMSQHRGVHAQSWLQQPTPFVRTHEMPVAGRGRLLGPVPSWVIEVPWTEVDGPHPPLCIWRVVGSTCA